MYICVYICVRERKKEEEEEEKGLGGTTKVERGVCRGLHE